MPTPHPHPIAAQLRGPSCQPCSPAQVSSRGRGARTALEPAPGPAGSSTGFPIPACARCQPWAGEPHQLALVTGTALASSRLCARARLPRARPHTLGSARTPSCHRRGMLHEAGACRLTQPGRKAQGQGLAPVSCQDGAKPVLQVPPSQACPKAQLHALPGASPGQPFTAHNLLQPWLRSGVIHSSPPRASTHLVCTTL